MAATLYIPSYPLHHGRHRHFVCRPPSSLAKLEPTSGLGKVHLGYARLRIALRLSAYLCLFFLLILILALVERRLIPAGPAYLAHARRAVHNLSFEEHDKHVEEERKRFEALNGNGLNGEDDLGVGDEEETLELLTLDPKEWKVWT